LAIIDLSQGAGQPMTSADGQVHIAFNGEIYNFQDLRSQLSAKGHVFRTQGDTEVILAGYLEWGEGVVERLDGMFALGLWDARNRRLLLTRDRTGKKPLYVYEDDRKVLFASEVKSILEHPDVDRRMWAEAIPQFLSHGYVPTPGSFWARIRKVRPSTFEVFTLGGRESRIEQYWEFPLGPERQVKDLGEVEERVRELFTAAVKRRLVSDVPLGAFLSGGIDSTLVVATMSKLVGKVKTFSIGFEGHPDWDETKYAKQVAERYGTEHTEFKVKPESFELIEKLAWHYDEPFGDSSAIPTAIVSKLTRQQVTVALTGDGGDELFAGYPRFQAAVFAEHVPSVLRSVARHALEPIPAGEKHGSLWERSRRFALHASQPLPERLRNWVSLFSATELAGMLRPEFARYAAPSLLGASYSTLAAKAGKLDTMNQVLFMNARTYLLDDLNVKVDRASMAASLETRAPFLDTALMEYAFSLPGSLKAKGTNLKWILKRAMAANLPDEVVNRKKMGFGVPLGAWFRDELRETLRERLLADGAKLHRFIRREALENLVKQHDDKKRDLGLHFWSLWLLESWLRANPQEA
jgi:asparagine synthase (glutamine-hydrolysing)